MLSKWLRPPSLRSTLDQGDPRHATWLELFYDLVFVVTVARLAELLVHDLTGASLARFLILFVPVWWAWIGSTYYATRFDPDDLGHRLLTGVEMLAVIALATTIDGALSDESAGFALAYGSVRAVLVAKYIRAGPLTFPPESGGFRNGVIAHSSHSTPPLKRGIENCRSNPDRASAWGR